ncbi:aminomethyltransferase family protein [Kordiimonas pumila]|uniref:Aminomethyltransferase folate-binding domain-containing protein n=1 Tax=Kordiimonas pumila TaxID=2161677 RepID=A0ABV7D8C5_9PROT|nr:hypothetical protein [Kordiimonas pumila]
MPAKAFSCGSTSLLEIPGIGFCKVSLGRGCKIEKKAISKCMGQAVPDQPNTYSEKSGVRVCWLSDREWLIIGEAEKVSTLADKLQLLLAGETALVLQVDHMLSLMRLSGSDAMAVIQKLSPIGLVDDWHGPAVCVQTLLGDVKAGLVVGALAEVDIVVDQSVALYAWRMLEKTMSGMDG